MDKKRLHTNPRGVKPRENAIQIYFRLKGEVDYCYETLPWPPTQTNINRAGKLRAEIVGKIKHEIFVYAEYFPDSPRALITKGTFAEFCQAWLDLPTNDWTQQTRNKFKGILQRVWMPALHKYQVKHINRWHITDALTAGIALFKQNNGKDPSQSLYNDWLLCIRGVFATAIEAGAIRKLEDPTQDLTNKKRDRNEIDPFDIDEANEIIKVAYAEHGDMWGAWFELGFYSGMRYPGEAAALQWSDVDIRKAEARINKTATREGIQNRTKNRKGRILYLNSRARIALERLKALGAASGGHVFVNCNGGSAYNAKKQRTIWREIIEQLGYRYRDMYNMRHTYATFGLMNGVNPAFMAEQLGHSLQEFFKTYAKWINNNQNQVQIKLIELALKISSDN
jgi:integrase